MPIRPFAPWIAIGLACISLGAAQRNPLIADAAEKRDAKAVTALLKQGVDVNVPQADGATALHWAAHWNDLTMARALIRAGANANAVNDYGVSPLFLAATNGSVDVLGALLDGGANPNASLPAGETVLMTAVRSGSAAAVRRLIAGGANVNAVQSSMGQTALMWAASGQKVDVVRSLIEARADVNARSKSGFTPLMFAAREGNIEISQLLVVAGANLDLSSSNGETALLVATVRGHAALAMALLERGVQPDGNAAATGYTPLHWAVARFEHPLDAGEVPPPGEWRGMAGIPDREAKIALVKALLSHGANLEAPLTKLMPAPRFGGTGTNSLSFGATPFGVAAMAGDAAVMRLLLANGANPSTRMQDGATPLMGVIGGGNAFTARRVSEADRIEAIKLTLELGNDIEAEDSKGYRAMHVAASAEFHQIILFLLAQGADLNPITKSRTEKEGAGFVVIAGQSPLGIVEGTFLGGTYNERPETAAFLRKLGAKSVGRATLQSYLKSLDEPAKKPD